MYGGGDHYKMTTRKDEMRRELKDKRNRDLRLVYNVSLFMTGGMFGVAVHESESCKVDTHNRLYSPCNLVR